MTKRWAEEFEARQIDEPEQLEASRTLRKRIDAWRERRNDVVHGLVKSTVGKTEDHIENFLAVAELSAIEGRDVARADSTWVDNLTRRRKKP